MPRPLPDLLDKRFGRLLVVSFAGRGRWNVRCDCGSPEKDIRGNHLHTGKINSCGCLRHERINLEHGHASYRAVKRKGTSTYKSWTGMNDRINNPNHKYYAGEILDMDPRWREFANFLADMGEQPTGYCLGRHDFDYGYWADNCFWEDRHEHAVRVGYRTAELRA